MVEKNRQVLGHFTKNYTAENERLNRDDFKSRRNTLSNEADLTDDGRLFQTRAATAGNARSPIVVRRVDGTTRVDVDVDLRRRLESRSSTRWNLSARYDGAIPCNEW